MEDKWCCLTYILLEMCRRCSWLWEGRSRLRSSRRYTDLQLNLCRIGRLRCTSDRKYQRYSIQGRWYTKDRCCFQCTNRSQGSRLCIEWLPVPVHLRQVEAQVTQDDTDERQSIRNARIAGTI